MKSLSRSRTSAASAARSALDGLDALEVRVDYAARACDRSPRSSATRARSSLARAMASGVAAPSIVVRSAAPQIGERAFEAIVADTSGTELGAKRGVGATRELGKGVRGCAVVGWRHVAEANDDGRRDPSDRRRRGT